MEIKNDYNLSKLNTFGINAKAKFFVEISLEKEIQELLDLEIFRKNNKIILGGGSNILFTGDFNGIVILNKLYGIEVLEEDEQFVYVKSMGGVSWDDLVNFCVDKNLWGIENLAFIPGSVGATPVQNIGAYGVEICDVLESVEAYSLQNGEKKTFKNEECFFGYRDSIFKNKYKDLYFISAVILKLNKRPNINIEYKALKDFLEKNQIEVSTAKDISKAVTEIRKSKLPDPKMIGNAGSFFKNIVLSKNKDQEKIQKFLLTYPGAPYFEEFSDNKIDEILIKIPTAWLIENCGPEKGISFKGYRVGNVGVHDKQALVLVNYGGATGFEVKNLAEEITKKVKEKFDLDIVSEVNII